MLIKNISVVSRKVHIIVSKKLRFSGKPFLGGYIEKLVTLNSALASLDIKNSRRFSFESLVFRVVELIRKILERKRKR